MYKLPESKNLNPNKNYQDLFIGIIDLDTNNLVSINLQNNNVEVIYNSELTIKDYGGMFGTVIENEVEYDTKGIIKFLSYTDKNYKVMTKHIEYINSQHNKNLKAVTLRKNVTTYFQIL